MEVMWGRAECPKFSKFDSMVTAMSNQNSRGMLLAEQQTDTEVLF